MSDTLKLPASVLIPLAAVTACCLLAVAYMTTKNGPFMVSGQEFGFSTKLHERLEATEKRAVASEAELVLAKRALKSTAEEVVALRRQLADIEAQRNKVWFPVSDVTFSSDGTFLTPDSDSERRGVWKHKDSELTLKLVNMNNGEVVLETNMAAPSNRVRIGKGKALWFPMAQFDYLVTVQDIEFSGTGVAAQVRVDRQMKRPT